MRNIKFISISHIDENNKLIVDNFTRNAEAMRRYVELLNNKNCKDVRVIAYEVYNYFVECKIFDDGSPF